MTARQRIKEWFEKEKASNIAAGRELGRAEGLAEARELERAEGLVEGQRWLVEKLLRLKFGVLSEAALARIAAATSTQLELWAERVLTAAALDEVWQ